MGQARSKHFTFMIPLNSQTPLVTMPTIFAFQNEKADAGKLRNVPEVRQIIRSNVRIQTALTDS